MEMEEEVSPKKFKLPPYVRNKYFITTVAFVLWVAFFDNQNQLYSYHLSQQVNAKEEQKEFYIKQIEQTKKEKIELSSTLDKQEKFAREKYHMKKDDEDLYIVTEKK